MRNPQTSITYERITRDLGASLLILHFNGCAPLIFFINLRWKRITTELKSKSLNSGMSLDCI